MQHNFLPSVLMLGGAIMSFHYNSISSATCPIMLLEGDSHDAKTTLLNIAMSLVGESRPRFATDKVKSCLHVK